MEWARGPWCVSDDPARLDLRARLASLRGTTWASDLTRERLERSLAHSLVFGAYRVPLDPARPAQRGFARVVSDRATFAWLCDVHVDEDERGHGLGRFLLACVHAHPALRGLRRWHLVTRDAHGLHARAGWRPLADPPAHMELRPPVSTEPEHSAG